MLLLLYDKNGKKALEDVEKVNPVGFTGEEDEPYNILAICAYHWTIYISELHKYI